MRRLMIVVAVVAAWSVATAFPSIGGTDTATLANTVSVTGAPVPCMTLGSTTIDWGVLDFADPMNPPFAASGSDTVAITNCSVDAESLQVAGTPATSTDTLSSTTWALDNVGPAASMCDLGLDKYAVEAANGGTVWVGDAVFQPLGNIGGALTSNVGIDLWMPCQGSGGQGETMTFDVNFLVTIP